jgi:hypothetical protein
MFAMHANTTGIANTATGTDTLTANTTGGNNTASGVGALANNTTGGSNTATGNGALNSSNGNANTSAGDSSLRFNTSGNNKTDTGFEALVNNTTGSNDIGLGISAGGNLTNGSNNIDIGNADVAGESSRIRIGTTGTHTRTFIAGINGAAVSGAAVKVNAAGQVGTAPSSQRFKDEIKPMDKTSEAILALKPVTFHYKKELDPEGIPQFGLVAEQVAKVNPDLVARDEQGKPYTVRYEAVNAMLLNEFLKEHHQVQDLKAIVAQQQKEIEGLTAGLQKVSAQIEASKPAPQVVNNP